MESIRFTAHSTAQISRAAQPDSNLVNKDAGKRGKFSARAFFL
jgi:hypothetical protein